MSSIRGIDQWVAVLDGLPEPSVGLGSNLEDDVVALRRLAERAQVAYLRHLARLDSSSSAVIGNKTVAGYVADAVGLPLADVRGELKLARALHTDTARPLEGTRINLAAGTLTVPQARTIHRAMAALTPEDARNIEPTVAHACTTVAPSATSQVCNHAVKVAGDEGSARYREEKAYARRNLHISPLGDMFRVDGLLTGEAGATLLAALDPLAQRTASESVLTAQTRSRSQLLHDALGELARRALIAGDLPTSGGVKPSLHVTVDMNDLLTMTGAAQIEGRSGAVIGIAAAERIGCDAMLDWSITTTKPTKPGELLLPGLADSAIASTGLIVPGAELSASDLAGRSANGPADLYLGSLAEIAPGIIDPALLDPKRMFEMLKQVAPGLGGSAPMILNAGRNVRDVTPPQRKQLVHRDKGCVYPGCDRPPEWCEAHHTRPWMFLGETNLADLALVCCFHHIRLHLNGETLQHFTDGWNCIPMPNYDLAICA